jgi:hypothetical protein
LLLRDAPRDFSEIVGQGVEERYTTRSGTRYTVLTWRMPGASRCEVVQGGERLDAGAAELACEWNYGRFVEEAEVKQHAQALFATLADCMHKELANAERDDSELELRGTTGSAHAVEIEVTTGNSTSGRSVRFQLVARGRSPGGG